MSSQQENTLYPSKMYNFKELYAVSLPLENCHTLVQLQNNSKGSSKFITFDAEVKDCIKEAIIAVSLK